MLIYQIDHELIIKPIFAANIVNVSHIYIYIKSKHISEYKTINCKVNDRWPTIKPRVLTLNN